MKNDPNLMCNTTTSTDCVFCLAKTAPATSCVDVICRCNTDNIKLVLLSSFENNSIDLVRSYLNKFTSRMECEVDECSSCMT